MDYALRPAEDADQPFFYELFCESRRPEFAALGLPASALEPLLAMQFRARNAGYAAQFPHAQSLVVHCGSLPVGALMVDSGAETIHLVDLAVSHAMQGRGLGTRIVAELVEEARAKAVPLRLSVRFGNPALRLYERLGFVRAGGDGINIAMEIRPAPASSPLPASAAPEPAGPAETMSSPWFRSLVGQSVQARSEQGVEVDLTLTAVHALPLYGAGFGADPDVDLHMDLHAGDSFSVALEGPLTPVLPPAITHLATAGGQQVSLFLSPLGPRQAAMRYEAVFNRMQQKSRGAGQ